MLKKRYFSVAEARQVLPLVKRLTRSMVESASRLGDYRNAAETLAVNRESDSGSAEGTGYVRLLLVFRSLVNRLQQLGCEVKDAHSGLVDFPHLRDGREVYLCWKLGENDIAFWHEVDGGYQGRQPLKDVS